MGRDGSTMGGMSCCRQTMLTCFSGTYPHVHLSIIANSHVPGFYLIGMHTRRDTDPGKMLCCETCSHVYHVHCLKPKLPRVPKGDWHCPDCALLIELDDCERILAARTVPASHPADESLLDSLAKGAHLLSALARKQRLATKVGAGAAAAPGAQAADGGATGGDGGGDAIGAATESVMQPGDPEQGKSVAKAAATSSGGAKSVAASAKDAAAAAKVVKQESEGGDGTAAVKREGVEGEGGGSGDGGVDGGGASGASGGATRREYLVKWKGFSYMHCR